MNRPSAKTAAPKTASPLGETLVRYPAVLAAPLAWIVSRAQRGDRA